MDMATDAAVEYFLESNVEEFPVSETVRDEEVVECRNLSFHNTTSLATSSG